LHVAFTTRAVGDAGGVGPVATGEALGEAVAVADGLGVSLGVGLSDGEGDSDGAPATSRDVESERSATAAPATAATVSRATTGTTVRGRCHHLRTNNTA
jgi:hypothetical protein